MPLFGFFGKAASPKSSALGYLLLPASVGGNATCAPNVNNLNLNNPNMKPPDSAAYSPLGTTEPLVRLPLYAGCNVVAGGSCSARERACHMQTWQKAALPGVQVHALYLDDDSIAPEGHVRILISDTEPGAKLPYNNFNSHKYCCTVMALAGPQHPTTVHCANEPLVPGALRPFEKVVVHSGDIIRVGSVDARVFFPWSEEQEHQSSYTCIRGVPAGEVEGVVWVQTHHAPPKASTSQQALKPGFTGDELSKPLLLDCGVHPDAQHQALPAPGSGTGTSQQRPRQQQLPASDTDAPRRPTWDWESSVRQQQEQGQGQGQRAGGGGLQLLAPHEVDPGYEWDSEHVPVRSKVPTPRSSLDQQLGSKQQQQQQAGRYSLDMGCAGAAQQQQRQPGRGSLDLGYAGTGAVPPVPRGQPQRSSIDERRPGMPPGRKSWELKRSNDGRTSWELKDQAGTPAAGTGNSATSGLGAGSAGAAAGQQQQVLAGWGRRPVGAAAAAAAAAAALCSPVTSR